MIPRVFQAGPLAVGATANLDAAPAHHLRQVLRLKVNDKLIIFNGEGGCYKGYLCQNDKKQVTIKLESFDAENKQSPLNIHLGQAISRGEKMDFTIQKAVELGVAAITPLLTEKCGVKLSPERQEKRMRHWQAVIISACEQCGRNLLPQLHPPQKLADWLQEIAPITGFVLDPQQADTWHNIIGEFSELALLVGSESGLTTAEVDLAQQNGLQGLTLGPRILRTETAALTAITALQLKWGDLG